MHLVGKKPELPHSGAGLVLDDGEEDEYD